MDEKEAEARPLMGNIFLVYIHTYIHTYIFCSSQPLLMIFFFIKMIQFIL